MLMDPRKGGVQQKSVLGDALPGDAGWIDSQIGILNLEKGEVGQSVAKELQFGKGQTPAKDGSDSNLNPNSPTAKSDEQFAQQVAGAVAGGLDVKRIGLSYLVGIGFSASTPAEAIKIANASADAYVRLELQHKYETLRQASDWLLQRYQALRDQASAADRAVVEFKSKHNIITAGGKLISDQQMTEVNNRLGEARAKVADEQAKLSQVESVLKEQETSGTVDATISDALQNPIITRLRTQYLDLVNKEADWSKRFGHDHLAVVNLRNQEHDIRNSTHEELSRIAESYKSDLEIGKRNEQELEKQLQDIVSEIPNDAQITLRALDSSAQSYHTFYDNFLTTYTESVQQETSPFPDTQIIAYATWAYPSNPSAIRVITIALLAGAGLGIGFGVLREAIDRSFRTTKQVQTALQVNCLALIPLVKDGSRDGRSTGQEYIREPNASRFTRTTGLRFVAEAPFSRFAEGIRAIKLAVDKRSINNSSKIIGLTSSVPREGKSTIAAALAAFAAHVGERVILVDCDLRKPALSRSLFPNAPGIKEVIFGQRSLEKAILHDPATKLSFLSAGNVSQLSNTSEILASDAMKAIFDTLKTKYDYIVVDLSPLAPVVDVRATTGFIDFYIFAVEWGHTDVNVVQEALKDTHGIQDNLLGIVLNKVNMKAIARYEGGRAKYYRNKYFSDYGYTD
jgi:succinoglycan biosynthesis transport protein ExoP